MNRISPCLVQRKDSGSFIFNQQISQPILLLVLGLCLVVFKFTIMCSKQNIHLKAYLLIQRSVDVKSFCGLNKHLEKSQLKAIKAKEITHTHTII